MTSLDYCDSCMNIKAAFFCCSWLVRSFDWIILCKTVTDDYFHYGLTCWLFSPLIVWFVKMLKTIIIALSWAIIDVGNLVLGCRYCVYILIDWLNFYFCVMHKEWAQPEDVYKTQLFRKKTDQKPEKQHKL